MANKSVLSDNHLHTPSEVSNTSPRNQTLQQVLISIITLKASMEHEFEDKEKDEFKVPMLDLSKSQFEVSIQPEEDPTVRIEIEETKSK